MKKDKQKQFARIRITVLVVIAIFIALFLYPFSSSDFLYRNAPVLKDKALHLKGASITLGLDPSFYYKFNISHTDVEAAVIALGLSKSASIDYNVKMMSTTHSPMFWNFWWWRPHEVSAPVLYYGNRKGNDFYLLYDRHKEVAYLYIQNT